MAETRQPAGAAPEMQVVHLQRIYTVGRGDTLALAASRTLGSHHLWPVLWWDNKKVIPNPDIIEVGQQLRYGHWDYVRPWLHRRANAAAHMPKPPAPPAPAPAAAAPAPAPASNGGGGSFSAGAGSFQQCVISHESGGNPSAVNPSSGAGGLYQFLPSTWQALGYPGLPENAPVWMQNDAFWKEYGQSGTSAWAPYDGC